MCESSLFSFDLECARDQVSAKTFSDVTRTFELMLKEAKASDWQMTEIHIASLHFKAKPKVEDDDTRSSIAVLGRIMGLAAPHHASEDVRDFQGVIDLVTHIVMENDATLTLSAGGREGVFGPDVVSGLQEEARLITVKAGRRSFGHVTGVVDKIILQPTHRSLGLIENITGRRIEVNFKPLLDDAVGRLTPKTEVDVKGYIHSPGGLGKPSAIDAEAIDPVERRHRPMVTAEDLEGILAMNLPEGVDSVSIIRDLRDGTTQEERHQ